MNDKQIKILKNRMYTIFQETKDYYKRTKRYGIDTDLDSGFNECFYYDQKTGHRCGIGRMMTIDSAKKFQLLNGSTGIAYIINDNKYTTLKFKKKYQNLPIRFYDLLQTWHDSTARAELYGTDYAKCLSSDAGKDIRVFIRNYKGEPNET